MDEQNGNKPIQEEFWFQVAVSIVIVIILIGAIVLCFRAKKTSFCKRKDTFNAVQSNPTDANTTDNQQTEYDSNNVKQGNENESQQQKNQDMDNHDRCM